MALTLERIRQSVIGDGMPIATAFGAKPLVYADYVASGRALSFVEDYIQRDVLPYYANTHTETSFTGRQTSFLRDQARQTIKSAVGGTDQHSVIFCGSGATGAVLKLLDILNLRLPHDLDEQHQLSAQIPEDDMPVVFIGPYEHHSNELPWRECIATVVSIPLNDQGTLDEDALARELAAYKDRRLKIGSFSAASNVTGIRTNVSRIAALLHQHGALSFWDYAAAGPYVPINMQGDANIPGSHLDAVFLSPHKFIGGPGTPGVLVVANHVCTNAVPAVPGGGTVSFVTPDSHRFIDDIERREEGGTPGIVESIRAGCVFEIQQSIGTDVIEEKEDDFTTRAIAAWSQNPNIHILGNTDADRLSIFSLRITWQDQDLHYGFIVALLNDLFGIQARGGCSCAGPYGHYLLGLSEEQSKAIEEQICKGHMVLRPGWTRLGFNYFMSEEIFEFIVKAVDLVATHGWRLLPYYQFDRNHGVWLYQGSRPELPSSLDTFTESLDAVKTKSTTQDEPDYAQLLDVAERIMNCNRHDDCCNNLDLSEDARHLCWFALPQEVHRTLYAG